MCSAASPFSVPSGCTVGLLHPRMEQSGSTMVKLRAKLVRKAQESAFKEEGEGVAFKLQFEPHLPDQDPNM